MVDIKLRDVLIYNGPAGSCLDGVRSRFHQYHSMQRNSESQELLARRTMGKEVTFQDEMEEDDDTNEPEENKKGEEAEETREEEEEKEKKQVNEMDEAKENKPRLLRRKRPNSTIKRFLRFALPHFCERFLFSEHKEFVVTKFFLGAGFGGLIGVGIYYSLVHPMSLYEIQKIRLLYGITGSFALGWSSSSYFRCTTLIIVPNILGKEGRAYLVILVMASIYNGPIRNLQHNVQQIVMSIGCTTELQINHTKLVWKIMITPIKKIVQDLVTGAKELKNDTGSITSIFRETESEMQSTEGYNKDLLERKQKEEKNRTLSTQKTFDLKTMLRCEYVIEKGIDKCYDWFNTKHEECMRTIFLPILNTLLCLPMKFKFLCNILYVVSRWCKNKIPVEGNFGQIYDKVNETISNMDRGFSSKMAMLKEEQSMFVGLNVSQLLIMDDIKENIDKKKVLMKKVISIVRVILSCTFVYIFISAYGYSNQYNANIRFDNVYVTTYFKQIDAHRKKQRKRHLLPLRKGERVNFVFPLKLMVQEPEMKATMVELLQCIPIVLFLISSIIIDWVLFHLFQIIRKHSSISYTFSSRHKLEILVGGDTFLSRMLRRTIGALNTSSSTLETSNNTECLPNPTCMSFSDYILSCLPVVGLLALCVVQVYVCRLRRVVAAFFFPKREKRRVLFLYNEFLRKRSAYVETKRKQIMRKARASRLLVKSFMGTLYRHCGWMRRFIRRRCFVCDSSEAADSYVCPETECGTVYCRQCWKDMKKFCFACMPYEEFFSHPGDSDADDE
ncbi:E3 ubiquitin-protein ligase DCST1 [Pelodytes ibericus]